jgi:hypothetical protein
MANPERPLSIFKQRGDAAVCQAGKPVAVEHHKACSVKPDEPRVSAKPEIPLARLEQTGHGILRQALFGLPATDGHVGRSTCFQRHHAGHGKSRHHQDRQQTPPWGRVRCRW